LVRLFKKGLKSRLKKLNENSGRFPESKLFKNQMFSERVSYEKSGEGALKVPILVWHRLGSGGYFRTRKSGAVALKRLFQG